MKFLKKIIEIFTKKPPDKSQMPDFLFPGLVSAKQFAAFKPASRKQAVTIVGDDGNVKYLDFMMWCVKHDPDLSVRLAALERLPNYTGQSDLPDFLMILDKSSDRFILEPCLSMTLSRLNLIDEDELSKRLSITQ